MTTDATAASAPEKPARPAFNRKNPLIATIPRRVLLTEGCDEKETWHFELGLAGSGLEYIVGDALAVVPANADDVVEEVLGASGLNGDEEVETKKAGTKPLRDALVADYEITGLTRKFVKTWQEKSGSEELATLLDNDNKEQFKQYWADLAPYVLAPYRPGRGMPDALLEEVLDAFEERLISQATARTLEDSMAIGWEILGLLAESELTRLSNEQIIRYVRPEKAHA